MWHVLVDGRPDNGTPLGYLGIDSRLEGSGHRKHSCDAAHRRSKRIAVVERADDSLDATLAQATNRRLVWPAHQCAHRATACQQPARNRSTLRTGGAQHQDR